MCRYPALVQDILFSFFLFLSFFQTPFLCRCRLDRSEYVYLIAVSCRLTYITYSIEERAVFAEKITKMSTEAPPAESDLNA